MRILLVDSTRYYPTNPLFLEALQELSQQYGWEYRFVDEGKITKPLIKSWIHKVAYRVLARRPLGYWSFNRSLVEVACDFQPDVVLVVKGAYISPDALRQIKASTRAVLINYATDDPFNPLVTTRSLVKSIRLYDVYACTKRCIMCDIQRAGCKKVIFVPFGYKPSVHFPEKPVTAEEKQRFASDVVFVGGCDRDRVAYFERLVHELPDIRLHLYGGYWDRHPVLRRYHRGFARGRDYRLALSSAKIAINLVRHANRDGHVMRSFEIPACGAFMLAERTEEHLELFEEDREAAFFGSPEELVEKVRYYLIHDSERERIAKAGYRLITSGNHTYRDRLLEMLRAAEVI